jgi:hypothetical protein
MAEEPAMSWPAGLLVAFVVVPSTLWAMLAVHYRSPRRSVRWLSSLLLLAVVAAAAAWWGTASGFWIVWALTIAAVVVWFRLLEPQANRNWVVGLDVLPRVRIDGNQVVIQNYRNFEYDAVGRATPRYETRTFDLAKLQGLDYYLSHWSGPIMAHTLAGFAFSDDDYLMISVEARRQAWQSYSPLWGLFRAYEITYVLGDRRDIVRLRTNRGERVLRYRLQVPVEQVRDLLVDYLMRAEALATHPKWYNSVTSNCTTNLFYHRHRRTRWWLYPQIFLNGLSARALYRRGFLDRTVPFAELEAQAEIHTPEPTAA